MPNLITQLSNYDFKFSNLATVMQMRHSVREIPNFMRPAVNTTHMDNKPELLPYSQGNELCICIMLTRFEVYRDILLPKLRKSILIFCMWEKTL